jgi:ABC-2 type transport system permease protein
VGTRSAVAWRAFADSRVRNASFAGLFAAIAYANAEGYPSTYPTLADRLAFARTFGANKTVELFYGVPHDLLTTGGFTAWRAGGIGTLFAAMWGVLAAVRALRAEEDAGRQELVLAGALSRGSAYAAALGGVFGGALACFVALVAGLVAGHLPVGGSAFMALATLSPLVFFVGVGALASQLAPTRQRALALGVAVLVAAFLLRVVGDLSSTLGWVRWLSPLGWVEEMRAFAGPRPGYLLLPACGGAALVVAAGIVATRRDLGSGLLADPDSAPPRLRLLGSPTALAVRLQRATFAAWCVGIGVFAGVVGLLSTTFTSGNLSPSVRREIEKLGGGSLITPAGALGFYFLLFIFAIALYAAAQVVGAHREEAEQRLETTFAGCVARQRWLAGRLALAAGGAAALALVAAAAAWVGAASQHAAVSLPQLLEAGANCLPTTLLFLGLGAAAFAAVPRATGAVAYGLVVVAFLWDLFGALLGLPHWLLDVSPFRHVGLVPAQPFDAVAAAVMLATAAVAALASLVLFRRRDLTGA